MKYLVYVFAFSILGYVLVCLIFPKRLASYRLNTPAFLLSLLLVFCTLLRLRVLLVNIFFNIDEAVYLTEVLTLHVDPLFYRSTESITSGPLNIYFLYLIQVLLARPPDYIVTHVAALLAQLLCFVGIYQAIRIRHSGRLAVISLLPVILYVSLTVHFDFLHYYSEILSNAALAWIIYFAFAYHQTKRLSTLLAAALLIGLSPFTKLQILPAILVVIAFLFYEISSLSTPFKFKGSFIKNTLVFGLAMALFPALIILVLYLNGVLESFWFYYFRVNAAYGISFLPDRPIERFFVEITKTIFPENQSLVYWPGAGLFTLMGIVGGGFLKGRERRLWVFEIGLLLGIVYAICKPNNYFPHYYSQLFVPIALLTASGFRALDGFKNRLWSGGIIALYCLIVVGVFLNDFRSFWFRDNYNFPLTTRQWVLQPTPVSVELRRLARPGDALVVWGSDTYFHVESGLPQGTRTPFNERILGFRTRPDLVPELKANFLNDLKQNKPHLFVDACFNPLIGFFKSDMAVVFPELHTYLLANYHLDAIIDQHRIYVRNEPKK